MIVYQKPEEWIPADGFRLESNAMAVAKSDINQLVVAGPGAGKTELLAQRACFLLQTNKCSYPKRILAISFKKDAAENLKKRVSKRLEKEFANRFTSMTFDAFAKNLIDRFRNGIPPDYRPTPDYRIFPNPMAREILSVFRQIEPRADINSYHGKSRLITSLTKEVYPLEESSLASMVLKNLIIEREKSFLTFPIISRLALLLVKSNSLIKSFLRQTYSHVFLDEFQDTTYLQYELLSEIFLYDKNILTAVGDSKQRIMLWAGAMKGIFETYKAHFSAPQISLFMNFRSDPRLVRLQNHLVAELMNETTKSTPRADKKEEEGIAEYWIFDDFDLEAKYLAEAIFTLVNNVKIDPREICLLFKQRPDEYSKAIQKELLRRNLYSRVEDDFQTLLNESIIQFLLNLIFACILPKSREETEYVLNQYLRINQVSDEKNALMIERRVSLKIKKLKKTLAHSTEWEKIQSTLEDEIESISYETFRSLYPQYNDRLYFESLLVRFFGLMKEYFSEKKDLHLAANKFLGTDCIQIMTVHKSKGLEFEVVFFIGFEDENFWNFKNQQDEDTCSFFVALSRAKNAVYFTFCKKRINHSNGHLEYRSRSNISPLFNALRSSEIIKIRKFTRPNARPQVKD